MKKTSRAGVSDTRAGLQPAGLFSNAGIFKKGFQDFHPLDESPYLLFDAESSMLGNLENPSLDLDASKAETLDVITATRAGIATFTSSDGQIVTADPDTVRVDWSLGYPAMLIEPSATNLLPYSEDFTQSSWVKNDVDVSAAPVAAPDGTMTAAHVSVTGSNPHLVDLDVVQANTHTVSIWARTVSGSGTCYFNANSTGAVQTVTDQWQRFEVPANNIHAYAVDFRGSSTLTEIYIWGAQAELGSVATSYIPTSGSAVTRNQDELVISGSNFTDFFNSGGDGTFYAEFNVRQTDVVSYILNGDSYNSRFLYSNNISTLINSYDGSTGPSRGTMIPNQLQRAAVSYNASTIDLSLDGSSVSSTTTNGNLGLASSLTIGATHSQAAHLNGYLKRVLYWPTHSSSL